MTCIRVNCDFDFDANCNKGVFISQNDYTNVHCAEGFVPDNLPGNIGHCTGELFINIPKFGRDGRYVRSASRLGEKTHGP